ncbi:MAG TPA: hypothetical protein VF970_06020 [Gemmatimonadales bacterium]
MRSFACRVPISGRRCLVGGLMLFVVAACRDVASVESTAEPSSSRVSPGASFDWSVPPRFGMDRNGDGMVDYPRTPEDLSPASWTVNFDACAMPPGTRYTWHVNERRVASVASCEWAYQFPTEGRYDVAVHVVRAGEPGSWAEHVVTVQDWLVVSFGDSYASGEGVPEVPAANDELLAAIDATLGSLEEARSRLDATLVNLELAIASLAEAFERKELADSILATQQRRLEEFLAACKIETFRDLVECADFLAGLPYDTYQTASDNFNLAVAEARERVESLTQAYQAAQAAFNEAQAAFLAAQDAVANLQATIAVLQAGLGVAEWQAPFPTEVWLDSQGRAYDCHRSANAAPARAALALEQGDPRTSVTFVHLACTGARIDADRNNLRQQIPWAEGLIGPREIDAVLVSVGGNDAGFASIATACVVQQACYDAVPAFNPAEGSGLCFLIGVIGFGQQCTDFFAVFPEESASRLVEAGVGALPPKYQELAQVLLPTLSGLLAPELAALDPVDRVRSGRVYITEYVDMTKDDDGAYCRPDGANLLGTVPGVTADEMAWLDVGAAGSINRAVADAAAAHGWSAVGGIYAGYAPHGYCADDHWVVRAHETFLRQGDAQGMAHPNMAGHGHNGQAVLAALMPDLYPEGLGGAPRAPDQPSSPGAPLVSGGAPPQ